MHLNLLGYDARRVIRTRAVGGYQNDVVPDVIATKDGHEYTFENKFRKNAYATIYKLYEKERAGDNVYRFSMSSQGPHVSLGTDFEEVKKGSDVHFRNLDLDNSSEILAHQRVVNLHKLLKGAQYLAIKANGKYPLFIRYWI